MPWLQRKSREKTLCRAMPDIRLDGKRVLVRPPKLEDWQQWSEVRKKNEKHLRPYEPKWPEDSLEKAYWQKRVIRQAGFWSEDRGYYFLVFASDNAGLIGGVNINSVVRGAAQFASIGYWIDQDRQGMGLMKESLELVLTFAFGKLRLNRINASSMPHNERSRNLLKNLGFDEEGFASKYIKINGTWEDHILFGLTAENYFLNR